MTKAPLVVTVMIILAASVYALVEPAPSALTLPPGARAQPAAFAATALPPSTAPTLAEPGATAAPNSQPPSQAPSPAPAKPTREPGHPPSATAVPTGAPPPPTAVESLVTGPLLFYGCATGVAVGAASLALPPMAAWAATAGALPAIAAVVVTSGIGCSVGLFLNVIIASVERVLQRIEHAWNSLF